MEKLSVHEEEVMLHIWNMKDFCIRDVVAMYPEPRPPYTTVASIVKNLKRKGYVKPKRYGTTDLYTPVITQSEYKHAFMGEVVRDYFANSYKEMVSFFARKEELSADDLKDILHLIEKGKEEE